MTSRAFTLTIALLSAGWAADSRKPVVVELFTSQGCSSCPPADQLLRDVAEHMPAGVEVIPLSEHVDYWDHLGWRDPFSSAANSARQQAYGQVFGSQDVYTPQMVVDGLIGFNGSDSKQARLMILYAADQPKAAVSVKRGDVDGRISVRVENLRGAKVEKADIYLAVTTTRAEVHVPRGENAGQTLSHVGVVRSVTRVVEIDARRGSYSGDFKLNIEPGWKQSQLRAVVWVQDKKTRRIAGAAMCFL